jgi:DNA-binding transcriptional MerR regulator
MPDDSGAADLTVGRAAALAGVSVRTLHHWDDIGLARPSARSAAGYRVYTDVDQERLRRIVVYRELGLGLEAIRRLLDDPATDILTALRAQQEQLAARIARLTDLQAELERMVTAHERGLMLSAGEQRAVFGPDWDPSWPLDARRRWGDTVQWQQYAERSAARDAGNGRRSRTRCGSSSPPSRRPWMPVWLPGRRTPMRSSSDTVRCSRPTSR